MKYKEFKRILDEHFSDEDEIFPHTGYCSRASFYKASPGKGIGIIVDDDVMTTINFAEKLNDDNSHED